RYVNTTLSPERPLPSPILLNEQEIGYDNTIWLTDPPPSGLARSQIPGNEMRRKYLEQVHKRYNSVTLPIGPTEGFSLHTIFQPLSLHRDPLTAEDLERKQRRSFLGEQHTEEDAYTYTLSELRKRDSSSDKKTALQPIIAENGE